MTPVDMLIQHDPDAGRWGDCFRCCIASLLDLPAESVPHFCASGKEDTAQLQAFLRPRGLAYLDLGMRPESPWDWASFHIDVWHVLSGMSPRGYSHAVVARNGVMVHDPHPSRAGLAGPYEEGMFVYGLLLGCPVREQEPQP